MEKIEIKTRYDFEQKAKKWNCQIYETHELLCFSRYKKDIQKEVQYIFYKKRIIQDNRIVSDYTFATRLRSFLKDITVNDAGSYEELEYFKHVAKELLILQKNTATDRNEIDYLERTFKAWL